MRRAIRLAVGGPLFTLAVATLVVFADGAAADTADSPSAPTVSDEDARRQAKLVDQEDQRLMQTRSVLASMLPIGAARAARWKQPQVMWSVHGATLVLPERSNGTAYTVADLAAAAGGRFFRRLPDGSYLLSAHVLVTDGATLDLRSGTTPLVIRMGSVPGAFATIVGLDGTVHITGTARNPVRIMGWNTRAGVPDTTVADGRPYIRAIGGELKMDHAELSNLGFWSGRTGGVALTGTDRPASAAKRSTRAERNAERRQRRAAAGGQGTGEAGGGSGDVELTPAEKAPGTATHVPAEDLVTGSIRNTTIAANAYGLFISGTNQTQVADVQIRDSLVHGVFLHRFVKNATVENTTVTGSREDGFVLSRATEKVRVIGCRSERNGRNGFTVNGTPLAEGPSASGESIDGFGDTTVTSSVATDNGRYGVELLGGSKLAVQNSRVAGGDMGIVAGAGATGVTLSGNTVTGQKRQGIALRNGVTGAKVNGNTVRGAVVGIYLRDSSASIVGNTIEAARTSKAHAISVLGGADGTRITGNTLAGTGTSAVHTARSHGTIQRSDNDTDDWNDTSSFWTKVRRHVKPMTLVWAGVFLMVIVSAVRSRESGPRTRRPGAHPYADQHPLAQAPARELREIPAARTAPGAMAASGAEGDRA